MEEILSTESYEGKRTKRHRSGSKTWVKVLLIILSICIWSGIVYYGYVYAKQYIDNSISNVEQNNIMAIQQLREEIKIVSNEIRALSDEIEDLKDDVRDADSTLSDANGIQENIDERLNYLDEKLKTLQDSLEILEGAPNVKN